MKNFTIRLNDIEVTELDAIRGELTRTGCLTEIVREAISENFKKDKGLIDEIRQIFDMLKSAELGGISQRLDEIREAIANIPAGGGTARGDSGVSPIAEKDMQRRINAEWERVPNLYIIRMIQYFSLLLERVYQMGNVNKGLDNYKNIKYDIDKAKADITYHRRDEKERDKLVEKLDSLLKWSEDIFNDELLKEHWSEKHYAVVRSPEIFTVIDKFNIMANMANIMLKYLPISADETLKNFFNNSY